MLLMGFIYLYTAEQLMLHAEVFQRGQIAFLNKSIQSKTNKYSEKLVVSLYQ